MKFFVNLKDLSEPSYETKPVIIPEKSFTEKQNIEALKKEIKENPIKITENNKQNLLDKPKKNFSRPNSSRVNSARPKSSLGSHRTHQIESYLTQTPSDGLKKIANRELPKTIVNDLGDYFLIEVKDGQNEEKKIEKEPPKIVNTTQQRPKSKVSYKRKCFKMQIK